MHRINIASYGWQLVMENKPEKCFSCTKELNMPFFFCRLGEKGLCGDCAREERKCLWAPRKHEHEHFNITSHRKEAQMAVLSVGLYISSYIFGKILL